MSQDLFAAFGDGPPKSEQHNAVSQPASGNGFDQIWQENEAVDWSTQPTSQPSETREFPGGGTNSIDDDDDFGDFEDASASAAIAKESSLPGHYEPPKTSVPHASPPEAKSFPPKAGPKLPFSPPPPKPEEKQEGTGQHPFAGRMDLLFEAGDDEYDAGADELGDLSNNPEAAMAYSKRILAEQESTQVRKTGPFASSSRGSSAKPSQSEIDPSVKEVSKPESTKRKELPRASNTEVLFDADNVSEHEDEDDDDDFGDFESWENPASSAQPTQTPKQSSMPAMDLLGLDDPPQQSTSGITTSASQAAPSQPPKKNPQEAPSNAATNATISQQDDDAWDDFETAEPAAYSDPSDQGPMPTSASHSRSRSSHTPPTSSTDSLPPTNIPPPLVLLSIFPSLFSAADDALFKILNKMDFKQRQMLLAHPASHQFLKGYLAHSTALAHIIAGRKLRWKRDQHLSQSMRIGPSAAGGKGGMKLTGVDKTEVAKEDREVLDVLRLWKGQVGKLRTAVTAASSAPAMGKLPAVPEISEQMPVKALRQTEGGITAPHACALCGLRREERVAKVDVEVEDSFGEWWVQGLNMHVSCKKFWDDFERKLKSR